MDTRWQPLPLLDIARVCASAVDPDQFFTAALPVLLDVAEARTVLVVRHGADGPEVSGLVGDDVDLAGSSLDGLLSVEDREHLVDVAAGDSWGSSGIGRVAARRLPGTAGVLVLAWVSADTAPSPVLDAALGMVDVTLARLDAEERLADLVLRVDSAQQLANMGDYDWHIPTDTNRWSDQLYRIYGHEPQSFNATYERFLANIHPDDRERISAIHQRAYATGEPYQMIERIVRPDGEVRYLSSNGVVIMGPEGAPVRMRGTCIDVTERMLAEQEREHMAARFRGLVESSPDAILVLDTESTVLQANGRANDLLGGDPVGRRLDAILSPELRVGAAGAAATGLDGRALRLDSSSAELSQVGDVGLVAVFLRDATERLAGEALATSLGEAQLRRRQALEINDNVVQGLVAAGMALDAGSVGEAGSFLDRTLTAARGMMDDLLDPLNGEELHAGELVRSAASSLDGPPASHAAVRQQAPEEPGGHRVLIVDDAEDIRLLLRMRLETEQGFEVVGEAVDGVDAVDQATALQPNVVLLDMAMPRMDGLEALPLIREAVPHVRVIVFSGFNQSTLEQKALAAGADRYMVKGCSMRELVDAIAAVA